MDRLELEIETQAPAIKALGSLFKLTEVYLWDNGWPETPEPERSKFPKGGDGSSSDIVSKACDFSYSPEDVELAAQMNELGLPLSFQTNKKRDGITRKNRKNMRLKHSHRQKETKDEVVEFSKVNEVEMVLPTVSNDKTSNSLSCMSILSQNESSRYDVAVDICESRCPIDKGEDSSSPDHDDMSKDDTVVSSTTLTARCPRCCVTGVDTRNGYKELGGHFMDYDCLEVSSETVSHEDGEGFCKSNCSEQPVIHKSVVHSSSNETASHDEVSSCNCMDDFGDWKVYWDYFYLRNYFYNIKTHESTWDPPRGMEHLMYVDNADKSNDMTIEVTPVVVKPSTSFVCSDLCVSEDNVISFEESVNRQADQPLHKLPVEYMHASNDSMSDITELTSSSTLDHLGEIHVINKNCSDSLCFLSDAQEHGYSQENKVKELGLHELNINIQCNYDTIFHISDDTSLTIALTEAVAEDDAIHLGPMNPTIDKLDVQLDSSSIKQKKKAKRRHAQRNSSDGNEELQFQGLTEEFPANISKYWCQRYLLFSRFNDGIKMDEEGWFSVTPEPIARHHAVRCGGGIIVDCFTGVGGNAIQFAWRSKRVIAIDIDPKKIDYAYHNATIYGVVDQIDFVVGNFFTLAPTLQADTVFLSPPWGGPDYAKVKTYDIQTMLKPHDGRFLLDCAKEIASRVVMFLPRNINLNQLAALALSACPSWSLEVEKNFLNGKLKAITAYFSSMAVRGQ